MKVFFTVILSIILSLPLNAFGADSGTDSITNELSKGLKHLSDESIDFVTTPFQLKNNNYLLTSGVLGVTALTYIFDKDIQKHLQNGQNSTTKNITNIGSLIGDPYIHLGIATLVYGGGIAANSTRWKQTGEMIGEALILADASTFIIKESVGRGRPNATSSKGDFNPFGFKNDYDSFPSMHTSSSFAIASVMASSSDNYAVKTAYYLTATFVGFSRMYKNKHWASDVILGAALGELSGRVITAYHSSGNKLTFAPIAIQGGAGLVMVNSW